jgi:2-polyprenyl-6-methoxyphenol hydroxylase-like FAD-dependent oxidoreductase
MLIRGGRLLVKVRIGYSGSHHAPAMTHGTGASARTRPMPQPETRSVPVAIVGGGPVGLTLALFLDRMGVKSVLFNTEATTRWHPRGSTQGSRTMEHYRRLGIADEVRKLGLPTDHPTDVAYFTRFNGAELARLRMPSADEEFAKVAAAAKTDQAVEPIHRGNQMQVERFLFAHAGTRANITLRFGWHVESYTADADGVTLHAVGQPMGPQVVWRADYLVGCDGGRSMVRQGLDIKFRGEAGLEQGHFGGRWFSTYLRAPELYQKYLGHRRAWQYWAVNPEIRSTMIAVNGRDEFLFRTQATTADGPPDDAVVANILRRCTGADIAVEIVAHAPWNAGVALVAEKFGDGRILLAGDAVHLFTPTGGFGMNTGIDDAANLAWKLAAMVQGWGGARLIDSYEHERMPIALRNTEAARQLAANINATDIGAAIELPTPDGEAARQAANAMLSKFNEQFASIGVQLGARYDGSPIVAADGAPPPDCFIRYAPTSIPGGRAPHAWLDTGRSHGSSLFDRLGPGFTLLRLGPRAPAAAELRNAAERLRIPLTMLYIPDSDIRELYARDLALIRPDQHVAWRGNAIPSDVDGLLARLSGGA